MDSFYAKLALSGNGQYSIFGAQLWSIVHGEEMYSRIIVLSKGKSTLLRTTFPENTYWIDLLEPSVEDTFARIVTLPSAPGTSYYSKLFEQFIIQECWKLTHYFKREWRLSYLNTKDDAEIDLVIARPGLPLLRKYPCALFGEISPFGLGMKG